MLNSWHTDMILLAYAHEEGVNKKFFCTCIHCSDIPSYSFFEQGVLDQVAEMM